MDDDVQEYRSSLEEALKRIGYDLIGLGTNGRMVIREAGSQDWLDFSDKHAQVLQKALGTPWP